MHGELNPGEEQAVGHVVDDEDAVVRFEAVPSGPGSHDHGAPARLSEASLDEAPELPLLVVDGASEGHEERLLAGIEERGEVGAEMLARLGIGEPVSGDQGSMGPAKMVGEVRKHRGTVSIEVDGVAGRGVHD